MNKKKIVFITGAGIDVESGVPAFRTEDGLWMNHKIEEVATLDGWKKDKKKYLISIMKDIDRWIRFLQI
jgi:NAD-dependent deacetylase